MKPVFINGVIAIEVNPPAGEKPIEWLLLTNMEIDSAEMRLAILRYYVCRWQVEIFFRVLKSGCRVEKLQLTCKKRYSPCLALYLIIAWRILYLTLLSRFDPDNPSCCIVMVASLGGFLNRKRDKFPGPTSIWIGLQRLKDFTLAVQAFKTDG